MSEEPADSPGALLAVLGAGLGLRWWEAMGPGPRPAGLPSWLLRAGWDTLRGELGPSGTLLQRQEALMLAHTTGIKYLLGPRLC